MSPQPLAPPPLGTGELERDGGRDDEPPPPTDAAIYLSGAKSVGQELPLQNEAATQQFVLESGWFR